MIVSPRRPAGRPLAASGRPRPIRRTMLGYPGIDRVMDEIIRLAREGKANPEVRALALDVTACVPCNPRTGHPDRRNFDALAGAIYDFIVQNIEYVRDPHGIEQLQSADVTLRLRTGDCDDMAILSAALLGSLGIPTRFVIVGPAPGRYSHIFLEYRNQRGQFMPFDPTIARRAGVGPSRRAARRTFALNDDELAGIFDGIKSALPVIVGGVGGFLVGGPAGAVAGASIATGGASDEALQQAQVEAERGRQIAEVLRNPNANPGAFPAQGIPGTDLVITSSGAVAPNAGLPPWLPVAAIVGVAGLVLVLALKR